MTEPLPILAARILIVDDDQANIDLMVRILNAAGYLNLEGTTCAREVVPRYQTGDIDLVLLDLQMPGYSGFDVIAELQALALPAQDYAPVLMITANDDRAAKLRALELGAKDFLVRPFDRSEVLNRIHNLLEVRLLYRHTRQQNEQLEEMVGQRTRELEDTRLEIIRRLGRAAEYRDNETGMHIVRMSLYAEVIAQTLGMRTDWSRLLMQAAPMHDIGKIGIPDRVLLKPGRLDDEEWAVMQSHARIGAELLAGHDSPLMQMAAEIAATHHERWDGSGYPQGLAGEAIPLEGRIAAVADVFDALTSERPYKRAWTEAEGVAEIERLAGSQFDPEVVAAFMRALPRLREIRTAYADAPVQPPGAEVAAQPGVPA